MTMKRLSRCTLLFLLLFVVSTTSVYASSGFPTGDPSSDVDSGGGGGGGGESGEGEEPGPPSGSGYGEPEIYSEILISPTVTALHSLNAYFAKQSGDSALGVYFIPKLEDFPVSLKDTAAHLVDYTGQSHNFAAVYDGYFNTEVEYEIAPNVDADGNKVGHIQTSKKVYSSVDNTRTLNLLGYDLLLEEERCRMLQSGNEYQVFYYPTEVGTSALKCETVVMDIYKALDQAEWDIKFMWCIDDELKLENNPIQSQFGVDISDKIETGIDVEEGATWVWATRTNPELYWKKAKRDAIFDGGAHTVTNTKAKSYVGSDVSVSFSKSQTDSVTFGEFCAIARAMMDLYGEPVMTTEEQLVMIQTYGLSLPDCGNEEIYQSVSYLAAKGVINPEECDLSKPVTFADIEPVLMRIADEDSRLTFKSTGYNPNSELFKMGYVSAKTSIGEGLLEEVERVNSDITTRYNDYFVECDDELTNFILTEVPDEDKPPSIGEETETEAGTPITDPYVENVEEEDDGLETIFVSDNIRCNEYTSASSDVWYAPDVADTDVYPFEFVGIEDNFYHFRIAETEDHVTIDYDRDVDEGDYTINRESYDLPNADGGVYLVENGQFVYYSFDEAEGKVYTTVEDDLVVEKALPEYSLAYIDNDRRNDPAITEMADFGYMSTYNWVYMTIDEAAKAQLHNFKYGDVSLGDLAALESGGVMTLENTAGDSRIYVKYVQTISDASVSHTYIFQVRCSAEEFRRNLTTVGKADVSGNTAYYCPDDNSVLVSYEYLRSKGLVTSMQKLEGADGLVLNVAGTVNTNVILRKDLGIIIVGDTLYKTDELLYYTAAEVTYINYRACIGWTSDYLVLNNSSNITLTSSTQSNKIKTMSKAVTTYYPTTAVAVEVVSNNGKECVPMYALNPLGNYLMVVDEVGNNDCLFMWKRKEYALPNDSNQQSYGDDGAARDKFKSMTGIDLASSDEYVLMATSLLHKNEMTTQCGDFTWMTHAIKGENRVVNRSTIGWVYEPREFDSFDAAATEYLNTNSAAMLPVAKVKGKLINLNINFCSITPVDGVLPCGQMPFKYANKMHKNSAVGGIGQFIADASGLSNKIVKIDGSKYTDVSAEYQSLADVTVYPAPVGSFGSVYGLPSISASKATSTSKTLFYGSQMVRVAKIDGANKLVLGPNKVLVSDNLDTSVQALYIGSGVSGIYSYGTGSLGINTV